MAEAAAVVSVAVVVAVVVDLVEAVVELTNAEEVAEAVVVDVEACAVVAK